MDNIESCSINKIKDKIAQDITDWWWCNKHKMFGKFYGMYNSHKPDNHNEWYQVK